MSLKTGWRPCLKCSGRFFSEDLCCNKLCADCRRSNENECARACRANIGGERIIRKGDTE